MSERDYGLPIEQFIQALTSQLDRAQATMALKARAGLPLTFAVKDISIDLRTHVEMVGSVVRIRPAGPGDVEASVLHLALTTITRPMIEENTVQLSAQADEPSLKEVLGSQMSEDEQRRLEWVGIHSVSQFKQLPPEEYRDALERVDIPVNRLRMALEKASHPFVSQVTPEAWTNETHDDGSLLLRIQGHNLMTDRNPAVRIDGEEVPVLHATRKELLIAAQPHHIAGTLSVEIGPDLVTERAYELKPINLPVLKPGSSGNGGKK